MNTISKKTKSKAQSVAVHNTTTNEPGNLPPQNQEQQQQQSDAQLVVVGGVNIQRLLSNPNALYQIFKTENVHDDVHGPILQLYIRPAPDSL